MPDARTKRIASTRRGSGGRRCSASPAFGDAVTGIALIFVASVLSDTSAVLEVPIYATGRNAMLSMFWGSLLWVRLGFTVLGFHLLMPRLAVFGGAAVATEIVSLTLLVVFAERARVRREIHDTLLQSLAALGVAEAEREGRAQRQRR